MSKRDKDILAESVDKTTYKVETVLKLDTLFIVCYDKEPIALKTSHYLTENKPRYKKTIFTNKTHAITLAKRLNVKFMTDRFTVRDVMYDVQVYPSES